MSRFILRNVANVQGIAVLFPKSVDDIKELGAAAKEQALANLERVYDAERNFRHTATSIDRAEAEFGIASSLIAVTKETSVDRAMRDEAAQQAIALQAFAVENFTNNKKLYRALVDVSRQKEELPKEKTYWLTQAIEEFERRGMNLPDEKFARVVELQKRLGELSTHFSKNISEDKTTITVETAAELEGVPEGIVSGLKRDGEKYILGMDYPTFFGVMKNCSVAKTRAAMFEAFESRAYPQNLPILQEVIHLRQELATILGFPDYAHYDLASKMAKEPKIAREFIANLIPKLQKKWALEREELIANRHPSVEELPGGELKNCDLAFAMNEYKKAKLNVSESTIQEYFPMETTVEALFKIYESFFDVSFARCALPEGTTFWHSDVHALSVTDNKTKQLLGHVINDLFPREGKFSHACCFPLIPAIRQEDGTMSPAVSVVLANFPKAQGDKPALFLYDDVKTFFHEFGHAIHGLMGRTEMATAAGTRVKRDFVELPSQMLEEWLWEPEILSLITSHYKTKEPLPLELIEAKVRSKNAFSGRDSLRQLTFATFSLDVFSAPFATLPLDQMDPSTLIKDIQPRVLDHVVFGETSNFPCNFGHLMGYAATYYGYMWSEVFAIDVFEYIRSRKGLLSSELGGRYVKYIIGRGGAEDPNELLRQFLEREPSQDAFLKHIGLTE